MSAVLRALGSAPVEHPLPAESGTCFVIHDFLDAAECAELVADARARGFAGANADYPPSYRDNERQVHDDPLLARWLFARLRRHLPQTLGDPSGATWQLASLNERLRFCRYRTGQQFRIHQDGVHHRSDDERSMLTFMVYLDGPESFTGGDTVFYASGPARDGAPPVVARVKPRRGSVIVFDHALWHAGEPLASGCKHVMRSDLLYRRDSRPADEPARPFAPGHSGYVWTLQRLADGRIASGGRDRAIRLWSPDGQHHRTLSAHTQSVLGLAEVTPGRLASVSRDRHLRLWDTVDGVCLRDVVAHDAAALCVTGLAHGRIATGGADGDIAVWNHEAEELVRLRGHAGWVWSLAAVGDAALASASEDGTVKLWNMREAVCEATLTVPHPLRSVAALRTGDGTIALAAGDEHGRVTLWNIDRGRIERTLVFRAHDAAVRRLRWLGDGRLASCGEDFRLRVWNGAAPAYEATHANFVTDVAELADGRLLSCGYDGELKRHASI